MPAAFQFYRATELARSRTSELKRVTASSTHSQSWTRSVACDVDGRQRLGLRAMLAALEIPRVRRLTRQLARILRM